MSEYDTMGGGDNFQDALRKSKDGKQRRQAAKKVGASSGRIV